MDYLELYTGEVLKKNKNGVWIIYPNKDSKIGIPVSLEEVIIELNNELK